MNESLPKKPGALVYVSDGAVPVRVPFAGDVTITKVRASPSISVPDNVTVRDKVQDMEALGMRDAFVAVTAWENNQPKVAAHRSR